MLRYLLMPGPSTTILPPRTPGTEPPQWPKVARLYTRLSLSRSIGCLSVTNMSSADRSRKLLERCALFSSLDEKARRDIAAYAKPRNFSTGEPICRLGDRGDSMMAIVVGTAFCCRRRGAKRSSLRSVAFSRA